MVVDQPGPAARCSLRREERGPPHSLLCEWGRAGSISRDAGRAKCFGNLRRLRAELRHWAVGAGREISGNSAETWPNGDKGDVMNQSQNLEAALEEAEQMLAEQN